MAKKKETKKKAKSKEKLETELSKEEMLDRVIELLKIAGEYVVLTLSKEDKIIIACHASEKSAALMSYKLQEKLVCDTLMSELLGA